MPHENSLSHRVVPGRTCGVEHMESGKKFAVAIDSTCANCRDGGAGYPKPGHRAGVRGFQTDSPAVEETTSRPSFARIEERRPAPRPYPKYPREKSPGSRPGHFAHHTTRRHSLEHPHHGQGAGLSRMAVQRIWDRHGLKPHLTKTFKLSGDKRFVEKLYDVVGLYLNPPDKALVLCVDEKSQIQALDRTQPGLPIKKGRCGTMTHDYKRNGTTTLFAALSMLEGKVIGDCMPRHRHQEFIRFLNKIDAETPSHLDLHLIVDNYATHKHAKVKAWLKRNPRFVPHFVPTSSSWMNLVERWFGHLDNKAIRRGVFLSVADLQASIEAFLTVWNQDPKPFVWTATVESIQEKLSRCRRTLEQIKPGCTSPKSRKRKK